MGIVKGGGSKIKINERFFRDLNYRVEGDDYYFSLGFFALKLKLKKEIIEIISKKFKNKSENFFIEPEIFKSPVKDFNYLVGNPAIYNITFIENKDNLIFYAYNFASFLNLKDLKNFILALGDAKEDVMANEIENFLRVYSALILPQFNSFLFHSSAILTDKGAYVFFGHSGAGKSTIANIFKDEGFKTLSDDLNILILNENKLKVTASPFLSEVKSAEGGIYDVQKIFYLKKDTKNFIEKASRLSQNAYFYSSLPVLNTLKHFQKEIFPYISKVINLKDVEILHFKKDKEIIKWLQLI